MFRLVCHKGNTSGAIISLAFSVRKNRHGSVGDLVDSSPSLSKQNRSLAKSTTAINNMRRASDMPDTNGMRGNIYIVYL